MKEYIITGATGYIGSNIVNRLVKDGNKVGIIVRENSSIPFSKDIIEKINIFVFKDDINFLVKFLEEYKNGILIHLAAFYVSNHIYDDIDNLVDSNIKFGTKILEAMKEAKINKFINTSTAWQHYNNSKYNPTCLYAATKEAFEKIIKYYEEAYNINNVTLEIFDTYGPNDNRNKILNLLGKYTEGAEVLKMSKGEQRLDLVYIDDIVNGYIIASELLNKNKIGNGEKFSLSSGNSISLKEIINIYERVTNKKININWGGREYKEREVMIPWSSGQVLPNWKCKIDIVEGIKRSFL